MTNVRCVPHGCLPFHDDAVTEGNCQSFKRRHVNRLTHCANERKSKLSNQQEANQWTGTSISHGANNARSNMSTLASLPTPSPAWAAIFKSIRNWERISIS